MCCAVCGHCDRPVSKEEGFAINNGCSYHKKCHKCYVCSETNLHDAEVFKGVIFCASCAQRIFQGCASARRTKNQANSRTKSRSRKRKDRCRQSDRRREKNMNGVIELAHLASTNSRSSHSDATTKTAINVNKPLISSELRVQSNLTMSHNDNFGSLDKEETSTEIGTTTDVTQDLLQHLNWCFTEAPHPESYPCVSVPKEDSKKHHKSKRESGRRKKTDLSDPRIAELGTSTEIANMTLRKKSEVPVILQSDNGLKDLSDTNSSLVEPSDSYGDGTERTINSSDYASEIPSKKISLLDRRLGSFLMIPYKFFKENIVQRSSLVNILMGSIEESTKMTMIEKVKFLFNDDIPEYQNRGLRRLYSTINRANTNRLGWVPKVSRELKLSSRCKHVQYSESYRCMRERVMKLAGPTKSDLARFRRTCKTYLSPNTLKELIQGKA